MSTSGGLWQEVTRLGRDCELAEEPRALDLRPGLGAVDKGASEARRNEHSTAWTQEKHPRPPAMSLQRPLLAKLKAMFAAEEKGFALQDAAGTQRWTWN